MRHGVPDHLLPQTFAAESKQFRGPYFVLTRRVERPFDHASLYPLDLLSDDRLQIAKRRLLNRRAGSGA